MGSLDGRVAIVEKDSSYEFASTPRSVGGIRQQFSTDVNIRVCLYSVAAFERFDEEMAVDGEPARCDYRPNGYLILGGENNWETLKGQYELQRSLGVEVEMLTPDDLVQLYPHVNVGDLVGGSLGRRAGYMDAYGVMQGYLKKARSLGARYLRAEVAKVICQGQKVTAVETTNGDRLHTGAAVLSAGAWSGDIAATMGLELPVVPITISVMQSNGPSAWIAKSFRSEIEAGSIMKSISFTKKYIGI